MRANTAGEIVSENSRTNLLPSSCISEYICIFVSSFYYFKQRNNSQGDFDTSARESRNVVTRVTHGILELMKNVSKSTSYTWKVFENEKSFFKSSEILKPTQVSFKYNSRRQTGSYEISADGTAFP